ncbi:MAG: hypothetical protein COV46_06075 [Deltaproteobacteria bacterium CG11_big_fil_rev_8_21_14_0_20_49_13]|nr:MAG: hypothetical protein COV46_06075 [Deltaproteobacteria bacterium CG11_big_fil_rev_8_21_14_0_20_49_13]
MPIFGASGLFSFFFLHFLFFYFLGFLAVDGGGKLESTHATVRRWCFASAKIRFFLPVRSWDSSAAIQGMDTATLCKVARGEVDLNQIAINHLAARGMDENGRWIGFDKAKERMIEE